MRQVFDPLDFSLPFPPAGLVGFAGLAALPLALFVGLARFLGIAAFFPPWAAAAGAGTLFSGTISSSVYTSFDGSTAGFVEELLVVFVEALFGLAIGTVDLSAGCGLAGFTGVELDDARTAGGLGRSTGAELDDEELIDACAGVEEVTAGGALEVGVVRDTPSASASSWPLGCTEFSLCEKKLRLKSSLLASLGDLFSSVSSLSGSGPSSTILAKTSRHSASPAFAQPARLITESSFWQVGWVCGQQRTQY